MKQCVPWIICAGLVLLSSPSVPAGGPSAPPDQTGSHGGGSLNERYIALAQEYVAALRSASGSGQLEGIAARLKDFSTLHPGTYEGVRATILRGDAEKELGRSDSAVACYLEAMRKIRTVPIPSSEDRREYANYLQLKLGDAYTDLGQFEDAVKSYELAIAGEEGDAPFGAVALNALTVPVARRFKGREVWTQYQEILGRLLDKPENIAASCLPSVVVKYADNTDRLRAMGVIGRAEYWDTLDRLRRFLPALPELEKGVLQQYLDGVRAEREAMLGADLDRVSEEILSDLEVNHHREPDGRTGTANIPIGPSDVFHARARHETTSAQWVLALAAIPALVGLVCFLGFRRLHAKAGRGGGRKE